MPRTVTKTAPKTVSTTVEKVVEPRRTTPRKDTAPIEPAATASAPADVAADAPKPPQRRSRVAKPAALAAAAATPDLVATAPAKAPVAAPVQAPVLKPLAALGVAEGLFVLVAAPASLGPMEAFARYAEVPLPHLVPGAQGAWLKSRTVGSVTVHVAYLPWPQVPAGTVKLGCITASGRKSVFSVDCLRWGETEPAQIAAVLKRYGTLLVPAIEGTLRVSHPLRLSLARALPALAAAPAPAVAAVRPEPTIRGSFDGVVDEQAHGWVWCPTDPTKRLTVEVLCGDEVVGCGLADRYRDDLQSNGIGDGEHHFRVTLSSELFDGEPHELSLRVAETGMLLPGRAVATLSRRESGDFDLMSRAQVLTAARELAGKLNVREPRTLEALLQALRTACLKQETGQLAQARADYERLLKALGPNALCHRRIGETWMLEHAFELALHAYDAAVECDKSFAWAHVGRGDVLRLQGHPLEAQSAYQLGLGCEPGMAVALSRCAQVYTSATMHQAQLLKEQGDRQGAVSLLVSVLMDEPENPQVLQRLHALLEDALPQDAATSPAVPHCVQAAGRARRTLEAVLNEAERRMAGTAEAA